MANSDNSNLGTAKENKNDEFYTQFADIQKEVNAYMEYDPNLFKDKTVLLPCDDPEWSNFTKFFAQNFQRFGLKKLISTSYAYNSKNVDFEYQPTLFETIDPRFEIKKSKEKGKIFTLTADENSDGKINLDDLKWNYLEGDGDFRSEEVIKLRNESDIIITNPPFSLFREFFQWLIDSNKKFLVIGNQNNMTYKEIFPYIKENKVWLGNHSGHTLFAVPESAKIPDFYDKNDTQRLNSNGYKIIDGKLWRNLGNICWYTNIEHGRRHQPLNLMSMQDNLKYHNKIKETGYQKYDNYDAIEIPIWTAIPNDYDGIMGVPISFLDKYCPEQFEIIGLDRYTVPKEFLVGGRVAIKGKPTYARVLIKRKK